MVSLVDLEGKNMNNMVMLKQHCFRSQNVTCLFINRGGQFVTSEQ